jgi:hypothetical protein
MRCKNGAMILGQESRIAIRAAGLAATLSALLFRHDLPAAAIPVLLLIGVLLVVASVV